MSIDELAAKYANMSEELVDVDAENEGLFLITFIVLFHFKLL